MESSFQSEMKLSQNTSGLSTPIPSGDKTSVLIKLSRSTYSLINSTRRKKTAECSESRLSAFKSENIHDDLTELYQLGGES
jgi:hypothetical protein